MSKKKTAIGLAVLAALAAFGLAATAKAADDDEDDGTDKPWGGPDPGKPGGPRPKKPPSGTGKRPSSVDPGTLWISSECDDLIVGERWWEDTVAPAIQEWLEMGYGAPQDEFDDDIKAAVTYGRDAVVRGILGPYSPLCIDSYPWSDFYEQKNPKPDWQPPAGAELQAWANRLADRQAQWAADYPALVDLIADMQFAVHEAWGAENA
jgi:hypothetical protein